MLGLAPPGVLTSLTWNLASTYVMAPYESAMHKKEDLAQSDLALLCGFCIVVEI